MQRVCFVSFVSFVSRRFYDTTTLLHINEYLFRESQAKAYVVIAI